MYVTSSATRPDILANPRFEVGYGLMPCWPTGAAPQNSIIGGATLWVLKGRPNAGDPRRRAVLRVPVPTRDPGALAPGDAGYIADHPRRLRLEPPSIVAALVDAHGGTVAADNASALGGARVQVRLPR